MVKNEIWKNVLGAEGGYQVSNLGRVKSLPRTARRGKGAIPVQGGILSPWDNGGGYLKVTIRYNNRRSKHRNVHQLVAEAFLDYVPNGKVDFVVNHIDHNKYNNSLTNLEVITARKNSNKKHLESKSEYTGVTFSHEGRPVAQCQINGERVYLGTFDTEEEARDRYIAAIENVIQYTTPTQYREYLTSKGR